MNKNFVLELKDDVEWQSLKMALCNYLYVCSSFESLEDEYMVCFSLLNRIGVDSVTLKSPDCF